MRILPKKTTVLRAVPLLALALAAGATLISSGQNPAAPPEFSRTEAMIAMRDGVKLRTVVYAPKNAAALLPFLLQRTPYGVPETAVNLAGESYRELVADGYIFVYQDIRGRFGSEGTFVMQRPPRDRKDPEGDRREHGRLRHRRLAPGESAGPQRPGRPEGRLLRRLARRHGHARSASGRQGRLAAGVPGRYVPWRRFPPQRRVPPELRLRVRGQDGDDEGGHEFPLRRVRHLRMVSPARASLDGQREIPVRPDPDLERLRRPSQLRRVLAPAGHGPLPGPRDRAHAPRRRLVGPGGLLRAAEDLRDPRAARRPGDQLLRRRSLEPRRLEPPGRGGAGPDQVRFRHVEVFPRADPGAFLRLLSERQARLGQSRRRSRSRPAPTSGGSTTSGRRGG